MSETLDMIMKGKYQNSSDIFASCYRPPRALRRLTTDGSARSFPENSRTANNIP
jgi:hypothetical protein